MSCVTVFDELYKTQYQVSPDSKMLFYKNSHVAGDHLAFISKHAEPAHFTAAAKSLGAAFLIAGEFSGLPVVQTTVITYDHFFSSEMMVHCYQTLFQRYALGDLSEIHAMKQFRPLLKEFNQRNHTIFS